MKPFPWYEDIQNLSGGFFVIYLIHTIIHSENEVLNTKPSCNVYVQCCTMLQIAETIQLDRWPDRYRVQPQRPAPKRHCSRRQLFIYQRIRDTGCWHNATDLCIHGVTKQVASRQECGRCGLGVLIALLVGQKKKALMSVELLYLDE